MRNRLIIDIKKYISYLNELGLQISIHGHIDQELFDNNIHTNPYCSMIKSSSQAWDKCINCQRKIFSKSSEIKFFGMCHAGVEEYIYFIDDHSFISVSGYGINRDKASHKISKIVDEFGFNENELINLYLNGLKHDYENEDSLDVLVNPLKHMINLLNFYKIEVEKIETSNKLFSNILRFVRKNYLSNITINDISKVCFCSSSSVSHLFKKHMNKSVHDYIIELRIEQSCKLLKYGNLSISQVASLCGFSDSNHFSTVFKKRLGKSPTEFINEM